MTFVGRKDFSNINTPKENERNIYEEIFNSVSPYSKTYSTLAPTFSDQNQKYENLAVAQKNTKQRKFSTRNVIFILVATIAIIILIIIGIVFAVLATTSNYLFRVFKKYKI